MTSTKPNCPACGSPRVVQPHIQHSYEQYAGCIDCSAIWEPLPPGDHTDSDGSPFPFPEPCDNCAFRPGSPEVEDRTEWQKLLFKLKHGGRFYCHKGVPLGGEDGFQYPKKPDGTHDEDNMRLCRGFLNAWAKWNRVEREEMEGLAAVCSANDTEDQ